MSKYGEISERNKKYMKHIKKPSDIDVRDKVRVVVEGPHLGEEARVVMRGPNAEGNPVYHVVFDHDPDGRAVAYLPSELERL